MKKKPQDLTLRNLRAMKKRIEKLEFASKFIYDLYDSLVLEVRRLKKK